MKLLHRVEENIGLSNGCIYQKWNALQITEIFQDKDFNSPIVAILYPGDIVQALTGNVHSKPNGKIVVTRNYVSRKGRRYLEGEVIIPLYNMGDGVYKVWHKGEVVAERVLDIRGMYSPADARPPADADVWGVLIEDVKRPSQEEWWVKVQTSSGQIGWTNQPYHFGNTGVSQTTGIVVIFDKHVVNLDKPPLIDNGTVLVQLSKIVKEFDAKSTWDETRAIETVMLNHKKVQFIKNSRAAIVNDTIVTMDAAAQMVQGEMMVPVRFFCEAFGANVTWDADTLQVKIFFLK